MPNALRGVFHRHPPCHIEDCVVERVSIVFATWQEENPRSLPRRTHGYCIFDVTRGPSLLDVNTWSVSWKDQVRASVGDWRYPARRFRPTTSPWMGMPWFDPGGAAYNVQDYWVPGGEGGLRRVLEAAEHLLQVAEQHARWRQAYPGDDVKRG